MSTSKLVINDPVVLDKAAMLDRVGGDEDLLREIAGIFLSEYPCLLAEIREAVAAANASQLEHSAHSLKGAVSNFGAQPATQAALQLEQLGRQKNLGGALEALTNLERQLAALQPALTDILDS